MHHRRRTVASALAIAALLLASCAAPGGSGDLDDPAGSAGGKADSAGEPPAPLEVQFLGVGGFMLRYGSDTVLTAPMYTNPSLFSTAAGRIRSNRDLVDRFTADLPLEDVSAILVGHAHYDHLMDVPYVWAATDGAFIYGNRTMRHILAAYAPDRAPYCAGRPVQDVQIPRDLVVQLNDPIGRLGRDFVDYRMCPEQSRDGAGGAGQWIEVPGTNVRFRALCSEHPDQLAIYHFGEGSIGGDLCEPPKSAERWLEGETLAYLIDFLDPVTREPVYRLYYQDAPTNGPIGHVPPELLAEKRVDVALLCVGNYNQVDDAPGEILRAMGPRYAVGGHWEDFFRTQDEPLRPLPFHDLAEYEARTEEALGNQTEAPLFVDGQPQQTRHLIPAPGTVIEIDPEPSQPLAR